MLSTDRSFWRGALAGFVGSLLAAELLCGAWTASGAFYRRFDVDGQLTSLAEIRDRLRASERDSGRILLLGDSVLGGGALAEHREADPRAKSLVRRLRVALGPDGRRLVALHADGLLLPDLEALCREAAPSPSDRLILVLNFRMFAPEFQAPAKALSRPFLRAALPEAARPDLAPVPAEEALSLALSEGAARASRLYRTSSLLRSLLFFPNQKDAVQRSLEGLAPTDPDDPVEEAALRLRVAPYYRPGGWRDDSAGNRSLRRLLEGLPGAARVVVVLSPQNGDALRDLGDPADITGRRASMVRLVTTAAPRALLADWTDRYPPVRFLDHCHLTAEGNVAFAADLAALLRGLG